MTLTILILIIFIATYVIVAIGKIHRTRIGRMEIAVISASILLIFGALPFREILPAIQVPTLVILLALMIISSQFASAGFYYWCANKISHHEGSPAFLLAMVVFIAGALSALLANDIIAFAMTPILCYGLKERGLDPRPFLFALMGAANAGSAATMIGNPQNLLIAEHGNLNFLTFLKICGPPALAAMIIVYLVVWFCWRKQLKMTPLPEKEEITPQIDYQQTLIGLIFITALVISFILPISRMISAAVIMLLLLLIRINKSWRLIKAADWRLLCLFAGLFIVNASFARTGLPSKGIAWLMSHHFHLKNLKVLAPFTLLASNTVGNVPSVILVLSLWPIKAKVTLYSLALFTTLAGNATIVGSLANIIVAEQAKHAGTNITFTDHLKAGLPLTILSMSVAWLWLLR